MSRVIVLSTGGIKSAVAAACFAEGHELVLAHVNYGQVSARAQQRAIQALAPTYPNARYVELLLPHMIELQQAAGPPRRADRSAVPNQPVRSPSRDDASHGVDATPPPEFEPLAPVALRGLWPVLCTVGAQCALRFGASQVVVGLTGAESASHLGIPATGLARDARRAFIHAQNIALEILSPKGQCVKLEAPLIDSTYAEIIKLADRFAVPLEKTWTCEHTDTKPCGQCEPCRARNAAFAEAQSPDPTRPATPARSAPRG